MPDARYLLWVDLETAGTDERRDPILEIGWVITTPTLHPLYEKSLPIRPHCWRHPHPHWNDSTWPNGADPAQWDEFVRDMHTNNGLIDTIDALGYENHSDVQDAVIDSLARFGKKHDYMLAGSGVSHFDRRFIKAQMPDLEKWLQYPNLDVGVLRRAWQLWSIPGAYYPSDNDSKTHRALDDIRCHLSEARYWCDFIRAGIQARGH